MEDKIYRIIEDEDGTVIADVIDGVTCIEQLPFTPEPFEYNEKVTVLGVPNTLKSVYINLMSCFPNVKKIGSKGKNPNWENFSFKFGLFKSSDQPREDYPCLEKNEDGTLTLNIPEGVRNLSGIENWDFHDKVTVIKFPASMEVIDNHLYWTFRNLKKFHIHPENPYYTFENGVLFSKDKKKIIMYQDCENRNAYKIPDTVVEIEESCFAKARKLVRIDIGKNVRKIGNCGLQGDGHFEMKKIYMPSTVTELEGEIFDKGGDDGGPYYPIRIVGGKRGSVIEEYCNERGIEFVEVREDEIEEFYAASVDELRKRAKAQLENETEFLVDESDKGYQMKYADGTLEVFVPDSVTMTEIAVKDTRVKINEHRREKVKKLIVGDRITEISALAFDDYRNLETVYIGGDVQEIDPWAFSGKDETGSFGCANLKNIIVDENNKHYKAENGVLYTYDMETLVKYCPARPELYHEIDRRVHHIGEDAFHYAKYLQCLKIGNGVLSVGELAFFNVEGLRHVYIADSVTELPERFPFVGEWGYDRPYRIPGLIIGGPRDSFIQKYCADDGVRFLVIEGDRIDDFLATPLPPMEHYEDESDPYIAECNKLMIVSKHGTLIQGGEFGEELVLPEGVVSMHCRVDLSRCKRVVIPSTYTQNWGWGISSDCHAPLLEEFIVSEDNPQYVAKDGHLYNRDGMLINYAPAAKDNGILPEGTTGIYAKAFSLISKPFKKLYVPASVASIEHQENWVKLFYEAEVSSDNTCFKAIRGSIFTADGKTLIYAKISENIYEVPDGTEVISNGALDAVSGTICIPASVTKIEEVYGLGRKKIVIRTPKGSYAEQYAKEHGIRAELTVDGVVVEEWDPPTPNETSGWYSFDMDSDDCPF